MKCIFCKEKKTKCAAVIVAAGNSVRMGQNKSLIELNHIPVLVRTVKCFDNSDDIDEIVIVTKSDMIEEVANLVNKYKLTKVSQVISGGKTRSESCLSGVSAVRTDNDIIAIHDGARPFVTPELISDCITAAKEYYSVVPVVKSVDTLRYVENGFITEDIDREKAFRVQTPQVFKADLIKGALTYAVSNDIQVTDDSSAMSLLGFKTYTVTGDEENIKLTTPYDLIIAESILKRRGEQL